MTDAERGLDRFFRLFSNITVPFHSCTWGDLEFIIFYVCDLLVRFLVFVFVSGFVCTKQTLNCRRYLVIFDGHFESAENPSGT
jgi:hypothetical protein